ncbi:Flp family type IVb pilin [Azospirillum sp. sgz302134]
MRTIRKLFKNESGATAIEYAILCALVAVFIIGAFGGVGSQITSIGSKVTTALTPSTTSSSSSSSSGG